MAIFKCKMCGGDLEINDTNKVIECEYCGTNQTVPSADNEKKLNLFIKAYMSGIKKSYIPADCFEPTLMDLIERQAKEHMRLYHKDHMDYNLAEKAEIDTYCGVK